MAWNPFGVSFELTATSGTVTRISATQYTVKINASWETYYDGAQTNYGMTASSGGGSVNLNTFGTYASSGSGSFTGTYSISTNESATREITVTFKNYNTDNGDSATTTVSFYVDVPSWTFYIVSYRANGGSGSATNQKKWKDQTLKLASTQQFHRFGYTFVEWNTQADGSGTSYSLGDSYTENSAMTLFAIWTVNKLTVNYYSNYADYGTHQGEILNVSASSNVLVYSEDFLYDSAYSNGLANVQNSNYLYLSKTGYTPTGYWGTSTSGGTLVDQNTSFSTGQTLAEAFGKDISSSNATVNVYAQWKLSGVVYIDNGTAFDKYLVYIDNGTGWDLYVPYIDNGTSWDVIS